MRDSLPIAVAAPAGNLALRVKPACVIAARAYLNIDAVRRRRGLPKVVIAPADRLAILAQAARMKRARAYLRELFPLRRIPYLPLRVVAPANRLAGIAVLFLSDAAGERIARAYLSESFALRRRGFAVVVAAPAGRRAVRVKRAGMRYAAAYRRERAGRLRVCRVDVRQPDQQRRQRHPRDYQQGERRRVYQRFAECRMKSHLS